MKLMDNLRHYAVQAMGAAASVQTIWIAIPDAWKERIPHEHDLVAGFTILLLVLGLIGHVSQGLQKPPPESKP